VHQLIPQSYYLTINKENTRETALLWVRAKDDVGVTLLVKTMYGDNEIQVIYAQATLMLNLKYVFRVSKGTDESTSPFLKLSSHFQSDQSYIFIPNAKPERIKLMKYLGKDHENFKWEWHFSQRPLSMTSALMQGIVDNSKIYRVSWPYAVLL
jgi:hypothetical protein